MKEHFILKQYHDFGSLFLQCWASRTVPPCTFRRLTMAKQDGRSNNNNHYFRGENFVTLKEMCLPCGVCTNGRLPTGRKRIQRRRCFVGIGFVPKMEKRKRERPLPLKSPLYYCPLSPILPFLFLGAKTSVLQSPLF